MAAIRAQRVRLTVDLSQRDPRLGVGELGWTVPGDTTGLAAAPDFAVVSFDSGARAAVRVTQYSALAWPGVPSASEGAA